ncbi:metallophosphoesterase [Variovorax sp. PCZ-1]|uniref:metallophosphoesterase family protein n=1 Tax=Variovorax sp. PCZ-1 TaxID=2835533 RepID=UPI001BCAE4D1|nr:metallophosphoesterase [Variovorax sp. PCZ-1]MBS7806760.1 metallophosphoesterase [Variovorax sp. PCZ-1]
MSVLLHISDTHFGTEQPAVVAALKVLAQAQQPELVVLTGDITQRARRAQFAAASRFTQSLGAKVLALPGNHDIPLFNLVARVFYPYAGFSAAFGEQMEPVYSSAELLVLGVNTTRAHRHRHGEISPEQIERVAAQLERASAQQLRVVVVHQPIDTPYAAEQQHRVRGHVLAQRRWAQAGADLVLGGHIHLPYVMPLAGLVRSMWAVQAGTAVSRRVRAGVPNSVNLMRWGASMPGGECVVEQWDFDALTQAFVCQRTHTLKPAR